MMTTLTIIINRGTSQVATSFLVWAKYRAAPQCDGDGVFVGEVEISSSATSVSQDWVTPNGSANWKFICAPKYLDQVGIFGQMVNV